MDLIQSILENGMPQSTDIQGYSAIYNVGDGTDVAHKRAYISCLFLQKLRYVLKIPRDSSRKQLLSPAMCVSEKVVARWNRLSYKAFNGYHLENVPNQI